MPELERRFSSKMSVLTVRITATMLSMTVWWLAVQSTALAQAGPRRPASHGEGVRADRPHRILDRSDHRGLPIANAHSYPKGTSESARLEQ